MNSVRFETVARLMSEFRRAGFQRVWFFGTKPASAEVREARSLPSPDGSDATPGRNLGFALVEGKVEDLERAVEIVRERLRHAGLDESRFAVSATKGGISLTIPDGSDADLVRRVVKRQGKSLEFHITVEREDPDYAREWKLRQYGEEPSKGFQWYALSDHAKRNCLKARLPEGKHRWCCAEPMRTASRRRALTTSSPLANATTGPSHSRSASNISRT